MHHKKTESLGRVFHSQGHEFWKWQRKSHKRKLSTKTNTAPNAPNLREGCRHSSGCWVRLSMPSVKHHLTIANANTANITHAVLYSGVVQEVNTSGYTCFLLKVLLQAGSHYTRAPTHKGQLICSNHSTECRPCIVKIAFSFFWPIIKTKAKCFKE